MGASKSKKTSKLNNGFGGRSVSTLPSSQCEEEKGAGECSAPVKQSVQRSFRIDVTQGFPDASAKIQRSHFKIISAVGTGVTSTVSLVQHKSSGKLYALKEMKKRKLMEFSQLDSILSEKEILEHTQYPFIVPLRFAFQDPQKLYLGFDFFNGGELFLHLQNAEFFDEPRACFYAAELLLALRYLHSHNIVYRDLKPENLLLDSDGHLRLADFGLSRNLAGGEGRAESFCGTDDYIAPEMILHHRYDYSVDYWAFGVLLYEMLSGSPPWRDSNRINLFKKIVLEPIKFKSNRFSEEAKDLLTKLLAKRVESRISPCDIPQHPFFKTINFEKLERKEITPPFRPMVSSPRDISNFDPACVDEETSDDSEEDLKVRSEDNIPGFDYVTE